MHGPVNVASPGTIGLHRMIRMCGRAPLPVAGPAFGTAVGALRRVGMPSLSPDFMRLLRYGRAVDTSRLTDEIGYSAHLHHSRRGGGVRPLARRREGGGVSGPERETVAAATAFMRAVREGLDAGLELPEALARSTGVLPGSARGLVRRLDGRNSEDEWGFDEDFARTIEPVFDFLYDRWWRVQTTGVQNVPSHGRALLAANHAGILPWDATMMSLAVLREHPLPRYPRFMVLDWAFELPWVSSVIRKVGGVVASPYNALRLLEHDELVAVFPEGVKGTGKRFSERYTLQRFGRGGFVELALRTGAPIVPVAVVGSEEIYPMLGPLRSWPRGCCARPTSRSPPRSRGWVRWGWSRCRRSGGSSSASRSPPSTTAPTRPRTGPWCSS